MSGTRLLLVALCSALLGCFDGCKEGPTPVADAPVGAAGDTVDGPPPMSVGTVRGLGPHVWEARLDLRGDSKGIWPSREVVSKLVWSELDVWEFEEITGVDKRVERQIDQTHYRRQSDGKRWLKTTQPAGNPLILQRTLQLWTQAVSGFGPQVAWRELGQDVVGDRTVRVLRIELAPVPALDTVDPVDPETAARKMGLATTPVELTGTVYVDLQTGNRLLAEIEGRFVPRAVAGWDPSDEVHVTYQEKRTLTSLPPTVRPPPPEQVVERARRPRSAGSGR